MSCYNLSKPDVAVVIINFNRLGDTIECLESLAEHCSPKDFFVILIDNNSSEKINELFDRNFPFEIRFILNEENIGFASANNIGLADALTFDPKYVFLLNNDTVVVSDIISELKNTMADDQSLGGIGAVNYYFSAPDEVWCAGIRTDYSSGKNVSVTDFDKTSKEVVFVDYVPGSSLMIRMDLLTTVGYLDDNFFAYFEEVDLCYRIKKNGFKIGFSPSSKILHKVGKSSPRALKEYLRTRNKLYFYKKISSETDFRRVCFLVLLRSSLFSIYFLLKFNPLISFSYFVGAYDFFRKNMGRNRIHFFMQS